jgi:signal transduction histidine kinase
MDEVNTADPRRAAAVPATRDELTALNGDVSQYLRLPTLPGEEQFSAAIRNDVDRAVTLVDATIDPQRRRDPASAPTDVQLDDALDAAVRSVLTTLDYDVRETESIARDLRGVRTTTLRMIVELDALSTLIALVAVLFAFRATRRHDELAGEHSALLTARVTELDRFSGRVAHDVLSPLGTIATGLSLLGRSADETSRTYIERSQRALQRVQRLVDDLLTFARSGARPDPASACAMDAILASVVADTSDAADHGIEIVVEAAGPLHVRSAAGVITSIVQNLVRNAIKYMGERPTRRVVVRASAVGSVARLEVEDTGPGIPTEIQATLFEPFVRGPREHVKGTGLGLATVKRLVESHGGTIGVESKPGCGSLFWVQLPLLASGLPGASPSLERTISR